MTPVTIAREIFSVLGMIGEALVLLGGLAFVLKLGQHIGQPFLIAGRIRLHDQLDSGEDLGRSIGKLRNLSQKILCPRE